MTTATIFTPSVPTGGVRRESQGNYRRTYRDFLALDVALASDDISSARQAYARLQKDSPHIAAALSQDPFPAKNPRLCAFKELGRALMSGNLRGAKQAFMRFN